MANIIALACSAALPTIGSKMTLTKDTDTFKESDAPCKANQEHNKLLIIKFEL